MLGCRRLAFSQDSHSCWASSIDTCCSCKASRSSAAPICSYHLHFGLTLPLCNAAAGAAGSCGAGQCCCCRTLMTSTATMEPHHTPAATAADNSGGKRSLEKNPGAGPAAKTYQAQSTNRPKRRENPSALLLCTGTHRAASGSFPLSAHCTGSDSTVFTAVRRSAVMRHCSALLPSCKCICSCCCLLCVLTGQQTAVGQLHGVTDSRQHCQPPLPRWAWQYPPAHLCTSPKEPLPNFFPIKSTSGRLGSSRATVASRATAATAGAADVIRRCTHDKVSASDSVSLGAQP